MIHTLQVSLQYMYALLSIIQTVPLKKNKHE